MFLARIAVRNPHAVAVLALAVGMLLDNGMVVLENTTRHLEAGESPARAAILGAGELAVPVFVATTLIVVVFSPVEETVRAIVPAEDLGTMISNIGVFNDWPAAYTPNTGTSDAFMAIQLTEARKKTAQEWAAVLREALPREVPEMEFAFDTGGLMTAALNFGLPSPINVRVEVVIWPDEKRAYALVRCSEELQPVRRPAG